jgi:hypothetical protein
MTDKVTLAVAGTVGTSPWWADWLDVVHQFGSTVAVVTGAIIGVITLYRMIWSRKDKE